MTVAVGLSSICRKRLPGNMVLKYTILPRIGTKFTYSKVNIKVMGGAMWQPVQIDRIRHKISETFMNAFRT
ncbi:hypothetical protein M2105_003436 [Paenibacillus sp. PastF-1]|nr:hypothetical protein [Paenibacillus sp. PastF-2]MDF9849002.1 hypothetical protein [Paenibacillus sp. PastM-2]MDF9855572.1 hypothetical protein [Paenibacillus sp. PastF-1]MDH6480844.1 hypothetical protein [Paenibacillus sp. PastH-2]MDH6508266.1 hypothetical protein [Paenibacillus sp. PastM-3]